MGIPKNWSSRVSYRSYVMNEILFFGFEQLHI